MKADCLESQNNDRKPKFHTSIPIDITKNF